ncbi:hypothetical protein PTKIN_Ptkin16aG0502000 [Pterospermum kingtungense]
MELQHFHKHPLIFNQEQSHESDGNAHCSGCGEAVSGPCFSCMECAKAPSEMNHPFHRKHSLKLQTITPSDEDKPTPLDPSHDVISDREIKHFSHQHNLVLCDDNVDDKLCDGCILFISGPYYHCSKCDFFLHKSCAELPWKKKLWFHLNQIPLPLISGGVFRCGVCEFECSGFTYKCAYSNFRNTCLRCALVDSQTSIGHEHQLWFLEGKEAKCNACGEESRVEYWCNDCNFVVHDKCLKLPQIARHKCDEHPLKLAYHDDNDYVKHHYCDICEEERNPNHWFYHCEICDKSAHSKCVLGKYPFIKPGSNYNAEYVHPNRPLILVPKVYDYPECHICRKRCVDLALECAVQDANIQSIGNA